MARVLIDEAGHCRVLQVLKLIAQVDRVYNLWVFNSNRLLVLDFGREEFAEVCLLVQIGAVLVCLLEVIIVTVAARVAVWRGDKRGGTRRLLANRASRPTSLILILCAQG